MKMESRLIGKSSMRCRSHDVVWKEVLSFKGNSRDREVKAVK